MVDTNDIVNSRTAATGILGGLGVFGGAWIRERRRGRKDAYTFAMGLLEAQRAQLDHQAKQISTLTLELGKVQGQLAQVLDENARLRHMIEHGAPSAADTSA